MRTTAILLAAALAFTACNNEADKTSGKNTDTKKKSKYSPEDSYNTDTMYQALPQLLEDVSASENMEDVLAQNWTNADDMDALRSADESSLQVPVRGFCMGKDHSVIKNIRNYMETGTWQYDADTKTVTFSYNKGDKDVYKIRALAADELRLTNIGIGSETILVFATDGKRHKDPATDPFTIANNQWRVKPKASETDEAVKQRVDGFLHFFILYYKDVIARKAAVISFYGFPSCLKWYAGGIYLQDDKDILKNWNAIFYNEAQAKKGYNMVSALLDKKYTWPSGNQNWIKKNLSVLEQMYANL